MNEFDAIDEALLATCTGGQQPTAAQQREMRQLARDYCPRLYARNRNAPITRPLAERCLDEAGLGFFSGQLDHYFGPRQR